MNVGVETHDQQTGTDLDGVGSETRFLPLLVA